MSIKSFGERIADVLIEDGLLLPAQLAEAMDVQKKQGGRLLKLLTDKGYVTEQDMVISMGRCLDTPPVNLSKLRVPEEVLELVPKEMARAYKLSPIGKLGNKLFVAMADPLNVLALDDLRQRTKLEIVTDDHDGAERHRDAQRCGQWQHHDGSGAEGRRRAGSSGRGGGEAKARGHRSRSSRGRERRRTGRQDRELDPRSRRSRKRRRIFTSSLSRRCSSCAIAWTATSSKAEFAAQSAPAPIASRIKILAGLDIAERRLPQDGRFRIRVSGKEVDLRISILPTVHGEKIVIRLLDKGALSGSIDTLGMDEYTLGTFKKASMRRTA
jgi:type IV pilus assembly protein PilB